MANFGITPVLPETLLLMLQTQLREGGTPSGSNQPGAALADRAFLSLFPDNAHLLNPVATQFVTIRPMSFPVWQSVVEGAGRDHTGYNANVTLTCFVQMSADPEMRNINAIVEATLSVTELVSKVVSAIQFWKPTDTNGNDLLREPARIADGGFQYTPVSGKDGPWVLVPIQYNLRFTTLHPTLG